MEKRQRRYYRKDEVVWVISEKKEGTIKSIDKENLKVAVEVDGKELVLDLWGIDKLKYKAKEKLLSSKKETKATNNDLFFSKVKENARIPEKAGEDEAGYDVWACIEPHSVKDGKDLYEILLPKLQPTLIPTGIATCVPSGSYLNFANERGSTGKYGMLVLSGIIDSTYRGEVFVNITPLYKDVLITSEVDEIVEHEKVIFYPYSKAICQMIDYNTSGLKPSVIAYDDLKAIPSTRGTGKLGSSGN